MASKKTKTTRSRPSAAQPARLAVSKPAPLTARSADPHRLYECSVQQPAILIGFIEDFWRHVFGRQAAPPLKLREDFCGTAYLSSMWAASDEKRSAVGVDLDPKVLKWATENNLKWIDDAARRVKLIAEDVMQAKTGKADVSVSLNFSHFIYFTRKELLAYLKKCHAKLGERGLLVLDAFGGPGSIVPGLDKRKFPQFTYEWEQESFDPVTHEIHCHIHFRFPGGTNLRRAFSYHWRLWSLPELRELLLEAGFAAVGVYFESPTGFISEPGGDGYDAWVAYLAAVKAPVER